MLRSLVGVGSSACPAEPSWPPDCAHPLLRACVAAASCAHARLESSPEQTTAPTRALEFVVARREHRCVRPRRSSAGTMSAPDSVNRRGDSLSPWRTPMPAGWARFGFASLLRASRSTMSSLSSFMFRRHGSRVSRRTSRALARRLDISNPRARCNRARAQLARGLTRLWLGSSPGGSSPVPTRSRGRGAV